MMLPIILASASRYKITGYIVFFVDVVQKLVPILQNTPEYMQVNMMNTYNI